MAALQVSYDRDWLRPRIGFFYATGDRNPRDRTARGFDSIFDSPAFAGGGFSFFNRLGIRLAQTGVALVERGSLLPSLRSSKDEGQPNYVNPGIQLATVGLDVDVTPRLKAIFTGNYIRFDAVEPLEEVLQEFHEFALVLLAGQVGGERSGVVVAQEEVVDFAFDDWGKLHPQSGRLERFVTPKTLDPAAN
jgi:hypothetical protein